MHILILGLDSFPVGLAEIQKMTLIGKGLVERGCRVTVVNRLWCNEEPSGSMNIEAHGVHEGIEYHFATGSAFRPPSWFQRKYLRLSGPLHETRMIFRLIRREGAVACIVTTRTAWKILMYRAISVTKKVPLIMNLVESDEGLHLNANPVRRVAGRWFDRNVFRCVDGILPISQYLLAHAGKVAPSVPALKVPVLVDSRRYDGLSRSTDITYLLFCGTLHYFEIIHFILESFARLKTTQNVELYLVVNGSKARFDELNQIIEKQPGSGRIKIFSRLTDRELSQLYLDAYALLIPLRPTIQDIARFPHKIGEYCASGRPVVTTNVGEIQTYFTNWGDAVIAGTYDSAEYAKVTDRLLEKSELADTIGRNGKALALREFDYYEYGLKLKKFIESLVLSRSVAK